METPQIPVAVGDVLAGKYRVERVIGIGGMGVVVAAEHLQLRQLVAIKFVLPDALGATSDAVERFLREARAAVRLRSEHVARVLDVGTLPSGAPFMVMEYLDGFDLETILERDWPLTVEFVAHCVIQACEALAEAHSLGIVHRDLKPQNLFLTRSVGGTPLIKVLDFGVSKMDSATGTRGLTRTAAIMGSPLYMAPEQMRSARSATLQSDLWALGVVLYHLLTGQLPFEAESIPELCLKVTLEPPHPLRTRRPEVPSGLEAVVARCLEKDPSKRFANAAELSAALEPYAPADAHGSVERAQLIARGMQPVEVAPTLRADDAPRLTTPAPWSSTRGDSKSRQRSRRAVLAVAAFATVLGAIVVVFLYASMESEPAVVGSPATLESATVTFVASSATVKAAPGGAPAPPPPPPQARPPRPPASSPPPHEDDIPTLR